MSAKHEITRADLMPMETYAAERKQRRAVAVALKRHRRVEVGPHAVFYFESYDTMWHQIHEMLHIEKGGDAQIDDELAAYNPLIPNGLELVATIMFEIDEPQPRQAILGQLGGVEETVFLRIGEETIAGVPEADVDRTSAAGKASAVQFVHFPFSDAQVQAFRGGKAPIVLGFQHPQYAHMAVMAAEIRQALAEDFD